MRINLLPEEYRPRRALSLRRLLLFTGLLVFLGGTLVFCGFYYWQVQNLQERYATLEAHIAVYDQAIEEIEEIEAFIAQVRRWEREITEIDRLYQPGRVLFWSLAAALPDEIWLTEVAVSGEKLTIKGDSLNLTMMGRLLQNINKTPLFRGSFLKEVRENTHGEVRSYQFEVEIETGRGTY